ncbi:molybdenum ABC transporter molybdate-binding protein [Alkalispirillum mobile]|uniref:Molybdenum ABC transporter molybdate-binding protein n=1 Tax=Alkalispirillum mobile TaxID=85925 RepID=A0A498BSV5_9GAMM|nr:molybdate ABC transporter substrate-binding protein [Alkalispirillum mobile]RLK47053.1 molybdenum ABC transporter molybdate-binding protein [Alkalispirillum mobile]
MGNKWFVSLVCGAVMTTALSSAHASEPVALYAAGSLRAALNDVADAYTAQYGVEVERTFAPSGLLRERIEGGEAPDVFASANMAHPERLAAAGQGGPVVRFARNRLCGLAQAGLDVDRERFLEVLLDDDVRVGTSTPKADPSGDYAWELFERAEDARPGSYEQLDGKALQLTGGPDSEPAPDGRNLYAWVMTEDRADIFLTYCTNAVLAREDTGSLQIIQVPDALGVGADYGLTVLSPGRADATRLALFMLSAEGQSILAGYGFDTSENPATEE